MKIAFVGKGGSGKSTISWLVSNQLTENNEKVLAIDSDYNMDLLHNFNLKEKDVPHFLNTAEKDFYKYLKLTEKDYYVNIPSKNNLPEFKITQLDWFTEKYSFEIKNNPNLRLMVTGMVPQEMLYGHRCGHAYISSLKYFIPLVKCNENENIVIDSIAGNDLVSYGMFLGCDAVVVVVEETPHSVGVFEQIKKVAETFSIPTFVVINKYRGTNKINDFIDSNKDIILGIIPFDESVLNYSFSNLSKDIKNEIKNLVVNIKKQKFVESEQWKRHVDWLNKYENQLEASKEKEFQFINNNGD